MQRVRGKLADSLLGFFGRRNWGNLFGGRPAVGASNGGSLSLRCDGDRRRRFVTTSGGFRVREIVMGSAMRISALDGSFNAGTKGFYSLHGCRSVTTAATAAGTTEAGRKKWKLSALFLFLPCMATFGLGSWQLLRRQWKIEVLDYKRKRLQEEPVPLADAASGIPNSTLTGDTSASASGADELEYRKVICEGVYDVSKSLYVGPRARSAFGVTQKGYYLITPLVGGDDGKSVQIPVLVNRGWVPSGYLDESLKESSIPENPPLESLKIESTSGGKSWWRLWSSQQDSNKEDEDDVLPKPQVTVTVLGVIRGSEQPNMFVPLNVPESGQWFYVDVPAMAEAVGLPANTILIEAVQETKVFQSTQRETFPIPKDPEALLHASVMPQDHINYALTWYSLSAATTYMAVKRLRNARRGF